MMAQLKKILLVDDDDDLREALGEQLIMTEDFDVFEADDGASAMVKAKEGIYDLVILSFQSSLPVCAASCGRMSNQKTPFSSLGHIRLSPRRRCCSRKMRKKCA